MKKEEIIKNLKKVVERIDAVVLDKGDNISVEFYGNKHKISARITFYYKDSNVSESWSVEDEGK